jgi:hypothetical protein
MNECKWRLFRSDDKPVTWCMFCGAAVNAISERTGEKATAMFYCEQCCKNYCDQCSYEKMINGEPMQYCLRCETELERLV